MSELECSSDGAPECRPGRVSRTGRRCGVILPVTRCSSPGGQDSDTALLEAVKTAPRRSSIIKDPSAQRAGGGRKKTVSFSSTPSERKVSSAADCLVFMQGGCELRKVRPNGRMYCRFYTLDPEQTCLRWEPSKKDTDHARLDLATIREVRTGKTTDAFQQHGPTERLPEEAAFSIIHGDDRRTLDLVALSADAANIWVTGLRYLLSHPAAMTGGGAEEGAGGSPGSRMRRSWLAEEFSKVDEDGHGIISEDIAVATICRLCPSIKEAKVRLRFKEIQHSKGKLTSHVTLEEFQEAYCELCTRPDVYFLLVQLSQDRECLEAQDMLRFLEVEQGLPCAVAESQLEIAQSFEPSVVARKHSLLGLDGFTRYLQSPECQLSDPAHLCVCQDMTLPLQHYYISTCCRSYMLEDRADLGALVGALQAGYRCLDLGVSDGPEGEPLLGAGLYSQAPPITLHSALKVVSKHAFLTSPFPLLVCLHQRCSLGQQRAIARHLREVLGAYLYAPQTSSPGQGPAQLPSPEELKGRVILAGIRLPLGVDGLEGEVLEDEEEAGGQWVNAGGGGGLGAVETAQPHRFRLCRELSDLMALALTGNQAFYKWQGTQQGSAPPESPAPQDNPCWTLCSLEKAEAGRLANEAPEELESFTRWTLTQVRPGLAGLDLSNPNPQPYWRGGCQLVAMNPHTPGAMLDLYRARFAENGHCGYVLCPFRLRQGGPWDGPSGKPPQTLRLKVIGAHGLPKPQGSGSKGEVIDPYVVLELHGVPADCAEQRTRTAAQNQDDLLFDETFEFQVSMPQLALLRFVVLDDDYIDDDFIGQYCVAFKCLQLGYRNVPLMGPAGDPLPHASLFIHVSVANCQGGGKAQKKVPSARRGPRQSHNYITLRHTAINALDDIFLSAAAPLREAVDLRESTQNAMDTLKELCGLPLVAKPQQCIQTLATHLHTAEGTPGVSLAQREGYPHLEALCNLPDSAHKLLSAYDRMISAHRQLIERADGICERIAQVHRQGMELQEDLSRLGEEEGLKGRKQSKVVESFTWNITMLKGQCELLHSAKVDALDTLRQMTQDCEESGLASSAK
ncbi:inactive phospholipase C-like protein 1 [Megalops cyprinoides]|uniref:inactive phospholipase C-like protein 1 n=1 Tax=Megalops cyprinoides TaxID=118141 RepID=UPI0018642765|nr:inactive phospholipase C-like protein 1 [Megalops cyprinoides]